MKEFDYDLDYKSLDFTDAEIPKLYSTRRTGFYWYAYTDNICAHWRFVDELLANLLLRYGNVPWI